MSVEKIRKHVEEYGFGSATPMLSSELSPEIFRQHYYDKKTLTTFCRAHKIPATGLKNELNERIETFLSTKKVVIVKAPRKLSRTPSDSQLGLALDKQVIHYKSDPATRAFFAKHIPNFTGFSAYVQKWLKQRLADGDVFTYAEVIEEHARFIKEKINRANAGTLAKVTHDSCQYNQFLIDFSRDKIEKPHSSKEAWQLVRNSAGAKTYARYKEKIQKITAHNL